MRIANLSIYGKHEWLENGYGSLVTLSIVNVQSLVRSLNRRIEKEVDPQLQHFCHVRYVDIKCYATVCFVWTYHIFYHELLLLTNDHKTSSL